MAEVLKISPIALQMLRNAQEKIGIMETEPHWGKDVQEILRSVQVYWPAQWDMAFIYYCLWDAMVARGFTSIPFAATTSPMAQWQHLAKAAHVASKRYPATEKAIILFDFKDKAPKKADVRTGDIFLNVDNDGHWHCGIIHSVGELCNTIEGCISARQNSSEIGVFTKRRKLEYFDRIIRINIF